MQPQKTPEQIEAMRAGGHILAQIFTDIRGYAHAGMTEKEVDAFVAQRISEYGAEATYKTPEVNFPASICISTNDEIVHGVPTDYAFQAGDVVSFDLVITYRGMKTDSAFTMVVDEEPSGAVKHLLTYTERSLYAGIEAITGPVHTGTIGAAVEKVLRKGKLGIITDLVGHGVGLEAGRGVLLQPGDTIAIEPMATLGSPRIYTDRSDGWTILARDGSLAAHFEHTVLITETGAEILTI